MIANCLDKHEVQPVKRITRASTSRKCLRDLKVYLEKIEIDAVFKVATYKLNGNKYTININPINVSDYESYGDCDGQSDGINIL